MIITVTPNPSIDRTLVIVALVRGQVHRAVADYEEPSGKGVNVSRALTSNHVPTVAVMPLGGDEGSKLGRLLDAEGVPFVPVRISESVRVNVSLTEPDGIATKINSLGPMLTQAEVHDLTAKLVELVKPGDWVVASGSLPRGIDTGYYSALAQLVHDAGASFVLDSSGTALEGGLAGHPDAIKPNLEELEEAVGQRLATLGDVAAAARQLIARGAQSVLVSLGPDGAILVTETETWHAEAEAVEPRSTIGAGDALVAGFVAAGGRGPDALAEAVAWGTASVGVEGSHVPVITDVHRSTVQVRDGVAESRHLTGRDRDPSRRSA